MAERERCASCGNEMPANAPQGLRPICLLQQGLESEGTATTHNAKSTRTRCDSEAVSG